MSTINHTRTEPSSISGIEVFTWASMGNADTGDAAGFPHFADKTVQIDGTFGSATVVIEGSVDGTTYFTLTDPQGNNISKTSAALETIEENVMYIRPKTSGGTGTAVNVRILARRTS